MPRNDLISFKKDKDAQFVAQLALQSMKKAGDPKSTIEDTDALDRLGWYQAALRQKVHSYKDDQNGEYYIVKQLLDEVDNLNELLTLRYILGRDPIQKRDVIIDATKSLKRIQGLQESLTNKNIHIWGQNNGSFDSVNGPWGSTKYVNAYTTVMQRCKEGSNLLASDLFDADDPQVVADFDELQKAPVYNRNARFKNIDQKRTYLMSPDDLEEYLQNKKPVQKNNNAVENNNLILRDGPDASYTVDKEAIKNNQKFVSDRVVSDFVNAFTDEKNSGLAKSLNAFVNDLKKYHYEVQTKGDLADESMKYADSLLSLRQAKKSNVGNNETYSLNLNLQNPEEPKFLDKFIGFIYRISSISKRAEKGKDIPEKEFNEVFSNSDGEGFVELLSELKKFENDPKIPAGFKTQCKMIQTKFENLVNQHVKELQVSDFEKYVTKNTGLLNFGSGETLIDGVAKVTAAYEWNKINERKPASKKETFDEYKMDAMAAEMKKNPVFKTYYAKPNNNGQWSDVFLNSAAKDSTEWKVNNLIDNPFATADRGKKLQAVTKLQGLADLLPKATDGSSDYERFNNKIRSIKQKNLQSISDGELNFILKDISEETEKYMKGRKSERYKDKSTEHFEESLDVLKIVSDVSPYGAAFADKLVQRTNYVRTHRWNGRTQKTVTLEGRSNEATKERLDILYGRKPAPEKNAGMKK